ncbi:MAG: hypothetical protein LBT33_11070, partial [Spirochaetia bacterium]|nr:hypothetical protein [Spirochaetia bacterium]
TTHNSGSDTVKTPVGMFEEDLIPNDLDALDRVICAYYGIAEAPPKTPPARTKSKKEKEEAQ